MTNHPVHHTLWYKFRHHLLPYWPLVPIFIGSWGVVMYAAPRLEHRQEWVEAAKISKIDHIIRIEVTNTYLFQPTDEIRYRKLLNVGLTYYSRGDGYTPGKTTRSGRFVGDGTIAVSQGMWQKDVFPGDFIYIFATKRWYKVEDTMHSKYLEPRVDIYTHDMDLAQSGSSKTDIIIMRQPQ